MQLRTAGFLGALAVALAAGSSSTPTLHAAQLAASTNSLSVGMFCEPGGYCEAQASGGTGGYSFTWDNAYELFDSDGWSIAEPACYVSGTIQITVTVSDSSGAQAKAYDSYYCG